MAINMRQTLIAIYAQKIDATFPVENLIFQREIF